MHRQFFSLNLLAEGTSIWSRNDYRAGGISYRRQDLGHSPAKMPACGYLQSFYCLEDFFVLVMVEDYPRHLAIWLLSWPSRELKNRVWIEFTGWLLC